SPVADLVCFAALWYLHERFRRPPEELDELRQLAGAIIGLALSIAGISLILNGSLSAMIEADRVLIGDRGLWEDLRVGIVLTLVGSPFWYWFWLRGLGVRQGPWRNGYAAIVAVMAWLAAFLSAITVANIAGQWLLGLSDETASLHFAAVPGSLTALIIGAIAFWHHRGVLGSERTNVVRVVEYVLAAVGLVAGAGAVVVLLATAIDNLTTSGVLVSDSSRVALAGLISLLAAAAAVWRYWVRALRLSDDPAEASSPARKATLLTLLVGFAITGVATLIYVLFVLLQAALEGEARGIANDLSWAIPVVLVSGAMCWHLAGLRTKVAVSVGATPASPGLQPSAQLRVITVVATDPGPLPQLLPGMRFLRRTDGQGVVDPEMAARIVESLSGLAAPAALVSVGADDFTVVPIA
ncbi:MAG TPA: DUF5671 domain-containing protein, partial [Acidimicrobiia bacterium]